VFSNKEGGGIDKQDGVINIFRRPYTFAHSQIQSWISLNCFLRR
jgi:hypothetical protein